MWIGGVEHGGDVVDVLMGLGVVGEGFGESCDAAGATALFDGKTPGALEAPTGTIQLGLGAFQFSAYGFHLPFTFGGTGKNDSSV